jgi:hypothetical protein
MRVLTKSLCREPRGSSAVKPFRDGLIVFNSKYHHHGKSLPFVWEECEMAMFLLSLFVKIDGCFWRILALLYDGNV